MAISEHDYQALVASEYTWLCDKLGLNPVALVFEPGEGVDRYGGTPRSLVVTYSPGDLGAIYDAARTPDGGPPSWSDRDRLGYDFWAEWRTTLWHEVCHQVQDQITNGWNPADGHNGHGPTWMPAITAFASRIGCPSPAALAELISSM